MMANITNNFGITAPGGVGILIADGCNGNTVITNNTTDLQDINKKDISATIYDQYNNSSAEIRSVNNGEIYYAYGEELVLKIENIDYRADMVFVTITRQNTSKIEFTSSVSGGVSFVTIPRTTAVPIEPSITDISPSIDTNNTIEDSATSWIINYDEEFQISLKPERSTGAVLNSNTTNIKFKFLKVLEAPVVKSTYSIFFQNIGCSEWAGIIDGDPHVQPENDSLRLFEDEGIEVFCNGDEYDDSQSPKKALIKVNNPSVPPLRYFKLIWFPQIIDDRNRITISRNDSDSSTISRIMGWDVSIDGKSRQVVGGIKIISNCVACAAKNNIFDPRVLIRFKYFENDEPHNEIIKVYGHDKKISPQDVIKLVANATGGKFSLFVGGYMTEQLVSDNIDLPYDTYITIGVAIFDNDFVKHTEEQEGIIYIPSDGKWGEDENFVEGGTFFRTAIAEKFECSLESENIEFNSQYPIISKVERTDNDITTEIFPYKLSWCNEELFQKTFGVLSDSIGKIKTRCDMFQMLSIPDVPKNLNREDINYEYSIDRSIGSFISCIEKTTPEFYVYKPIDNNSSLKIYFSNVIESENLRLVINTMALRYSKDDKGYLLDIRGNSPTFVCSVIDDYSITSDQPYYDLSDLEEGVIYMLNFSFLEYNNGYNSLSRKSKNIYLYIPYDYVTPTPTDIIQS